jgi:hypothetical protein
MSKDSVKVIVEEGVQEPLGKEHIARLWTSFKLISQFFDIIIIAATLHLPSGGREGPERRAPPPPFS